MLAPRLRAARGQVNHRELVHDKPIVRRRQIEIEQAHPVAGDGTIGTRVFHLNAIAQHPVEGAVRLHQRRRPHPQDFPQRLLPRLLRNRRIQPQDRLTQAPHQHHRAKRIPPVCACL